MMAQALEMLAPIELRPNSGVDENLDYQESEHPLRAPALKQSAIASLCIRQARACSLVYAFGACRPTLYN